MDLKTSWHSSKGNITLSFRAGSVEIDFVPECRVGINLDGVLHCKYCIESS